MSQWALENDDLPPVFFDPVHVLHASAMPIRTFGATHQRGVWWTNAAVYFHAFDEPLPPEVLQSPRAAPRWGDLERGRGGVVTDYPIADCFFAAPAFWTLDGQSGPEQWRPQAITSVRYASSKGLIRQSGVSWDTELGPGAPACCALPIRSSVLFADGSCENLVQRDLRPGVPHAYMPDARLPHAWEPGPPIRNTEHGVLGRDR